MERSISLLRELLPSHTHTHEWPPGVVHPSHSETAGDVCL